MDTIQLLKSDDHYYGELGRQFLSNSDIRALLTNPSMFKVPQEDSKALVEGRYFHQLMLEPYKVNHLQFVDASSRNTNIYKDALAASGADYLMLLKEAQEIQALVSSMRSNVTFFEDIYSDMNTYEEPAITEIMGTMWKGKADVVCPDMIIDLKTTSDINKFKHSAYSYNYDSQCYLYQTMFDRPLVFYVIDKSTHQLGVFRPTEEFVKRGRDKVLKAIDVYKKFFGPDSTADVSNYFMVEELI